MIYIGKNSDNEYYKLPSYVTRYLEYFKITPCSKYPYHDPNLGEAGLVDFYYDNDSKTELDYEVKDNKWKILEANKEVASISSKVINIEGYCISSSNGENKLSVKMDSDYSGISSEVFVTIINDKRIDISLNCVGLGGEYKKSTTISKGAQFFYPKEYFDKMIESVDSEKYWRCSDKKISDRDTESMREIGLLDQLIHDERLADALVEKMKIMAKWEYDNTMRKIRTGKSDKKSINQESFEKERMMFESSDVGDIIYNTHR